MDTGNSHMRFYDVTSWSYVNLDDPVDLYSNSSRTNEINAALE